MKPVQGTPPSARDLYWKPLVDTRRRLALTAILALVLLATAPMSIMRMAGGDAIAVITTVTFVTWCYARQREAHRQHGVRWIGGRYS